MVSFSLPAHHQIDIVFRAVCSTCLFALKLGGLTWRKDENGPGFDISWWCPKRFLFKCEYVTFNIFTLTSRIWENSLFAGHIYCFVGLFKDRTMMKIIPGLFSQSSITLFKPLITFVSNWMGKKNRQSSTAFMQHVIKHPSSDWAALLLFVV